MNKEIIKSNWFNPDKDYIVLEIKNNKNVKQFFLPSITLNGDCYIRADFRKDGEFPEISAWVDSIKTTPRIRFRMKKGKFQSGVCVIVNDIEQIYLGEIQKEFSRVHEFESEYLTTPAYYAKVFTTKVNFTRKHKKYGLLPAPKTMSQFVEVLNWLNPKLTNFGNAYWRGMANIKWSVEAGAARELREGLEKSRKLREGLEKSRELREGLEKSKEEAEKSGYMWIAPDSNLFITDKELTHFLNDARQQGHGFRDGRQLSDLELLSVLQHHGAATRLLNFTTNAWIALWFATEKYFNTDGVLVMALVHDTDVILSHEDSQKPIGEILPDLSSPSPEGYWHTHRNYFWHPTCFYERMRTQQSVFLVSYHDATAVEQGKWSSFPSPDMRFNCGTNHPDHSITFKAIAIPTSLKQDMRDKWIPMFGYDKRFIYPDLTGFAQHWSYNPNG